MTDKREDPIPRIIREGWKQIDAEVDAIMERADKAEPDELAYLKARARGKAEILAYAMNVAYPLAWRAATADDVSREAGRRAAQRAKGVTYGTVGVEWNTAVLTASREGLRVTDDKRGVFS